MKKSILVVIILFLFFIFGVQKSQAHVIASDGTVAALLHTEPEDDPIVKSPATFHFHFKDTAKKFSLSKCECGFSIAPADMPEKIYRIDPKDISIANDVDASFQYTFPEKGIYLVKVDGPDFTLTFDLRISRETPSSFSEKVPYYIALFAHHFLHILIFAGGFVAVIIVVIRDKRKERAIMAGISLKQ